MDATTFRTPTGWFAQSGDLRVGEFATAEEATAALTLALAAGELLAALEAFTAKIEAGYKGFAENGPEHKAARAAIRKAQGA